MKNYEYSLINNTKPAPNVIDDDVTQKLTSGLRKERTAKSKEKRTKKKQAGAAGESAEKKFLPPRVDSIFPTEKLDYEHLPAEKQKEFLQITMEQTEAALRQRTDAILQGEKAINLIIDN